MEGSFISLSNLTQNTDPSALQESDIELVGQRNMSLYQIIDKSRMIFQNKG